ncbi:glycosyltransferase [Belliella sp. DSM 111904]|uniref:Glycosyltransferase n=1 Tax=Belliella filtrata TaxID=2923435 RepID=A0ABS9UYC4_9BACT|nr:glycosyltransferase [Belliella filtrata]MCH7409167.1 glycosyltransferase [Belliella filtrata]
MITLFLFLGIVYATLMILLGLLWQGNTSFAKTEGCDYQATMLVPFRNEEGNLRLIFESVERQIIRPMEVIWIDDHSEDRSIALLEDLIKNSTYTSQHILLRSSHQGKKAAIEAAVNQAKGDLIFTTDADCEVTPLWIMSMLEKFSDPKVMLVAGPVMNKQKVGFFDAFQQLDWASIILVSHTAIRLKRPLMCSGANLAYRKSAFVEVSGYEGNRSLLSGDDEFLLKKIAQKYGSEAIAYERSNSSLVVTNSHGDWGTMLSQRVRWASKWRGHDFVHGIFSLVPFCFQLFWIFTIAFPVLHGFEGLLLLIFLWFSKCVVEGFVLGKVCSHFNVFPTWQHRILTSMIHPFYVIVVGIWSIRGRYKWKGRVSF